MSFYQSIRCSLLAFFQPSTSELASSRDSQVTIEDIRTMMLDMAGPPDDESQMLVRRIRYAVDPQALWFIRSELMGLLARREGEALARTRLEVLSDMFGDLLPSALRSRPSPLHGGRAERHGAQLR